MKTINLISGPRNLSTALMYSFAQRDDFQVLDEPFYGYYLKNSSFSVPHPSQKEIVASMETDDEKIIGNINRLSPLRHLFIKGMAQHYLTKNPSYILDWENIILIRHPKKLIASFSKVIKNPKLEDIGIKKASQLFLYLQRNNKTPVVIDSDELLKDPAAYLKKLCRILHIPYSKKMLSWKEGGIAEDGNWAPHWYHNVHNSTGFTIQKSKLQPLPKFLKPLLNEAMPYYNTLKQQILKID